MTLAEIKAAVDAGKTVHWANEGYTVLKDGFGEYLISYMQLDAIGLTHSDGVTMNGREDQFFLGTDAPLKERKENDDQLKGVLPTPVGQQQDGADSGFNVR